MAVDTNLKKNFEEFYTRLLPFLNKAGEGGGHTIKDNGASMDDRSSLNLIGFDVTDNSGDDETDVEAHRLTSEEMGEIFETLPGAPTTLPRYSTAEQVIGYWVNGKPLYQKSFIYPSIISISSTITTTDIADITDLGVDKVIALFGSCVWGTAQVALPYIVNTDSQRFDADLFCMNKDSRFLLQLRSYRSVGTVDASNIVITLQYTKTTDVAP